LKRKLTLKISGILARVNVGNPREMASTRLHALLRGPTARGSDDIPRPTKSSHSSKGLHQALISVYVAMSEISRSDINMGRGAGRE
jgi:hypothetical protein